MRSVWKRFVSVFWAFALFLGLLPELIPAVHASAAEDLTKWQVTNNALTAAQNGTYSLVGLAKKGNARQYNKLWSPVAFEGNLSVTFEAKFSTTKNDTMLFFTPRGVAAEDPRDNFTTGYLCNFVIAGSNNGLRFGESNSSSNILSSDRQISANSDWTETEMWYTVKWMIIGNTQYLKYWPSALPEPDAWVYQYEDTAGKAPSKGYVVFAKRSTDAVELRNVTVTQLPSVYQSVAPLAALRVPKGTGLDGLKLPDSATIYLDNGTAKTVKVSRWDTSEYRGDTLGSYVLTGTLAANHGENPNQLMATITVNVYDSSVKAEETVSLRYDDRYNVAGKKVSVSDSGSAVSYQVGYGISKNVPDTAVVRYDSSAQQIVAVGIGTAFLEIDGKIYQFDVSPAPISLFLMIGQSNMAGNEGNANASIANTDGQVYSSYAPATAATLPGATVFLTQKNAASWVASSLAGSQKGIAVDGSSGNLGRYPIDSLTGSGTGKMGPDSGFAYEWVKLTGEKVWLVNAAHGGSSITTWQTNGDNYKEAVAIFQAAQKTLQAEIQAGHYTLSHMGYLWCQGCNTNDRQMDAQWYVERFSAMHQGLKAALSTDVDLDGKADPLEFANIVLCRSCSHTNYACQHSDKSWSTKDYYGYADLEMSGPRVAQYYMGNSADAKFADIHVVSNIGDQWVYWQDGSNDVKEFFLSRYPSERLDYPVQSGTLAMPTKPEDVHDSIHYNQVGYNEVGREAARNTFYLLYPEKQPQAAVSIKLYAWDGITDLAGETGEQGEQLVVPVVWPLYRAKELQITVAGKTYDHYLYSGDEAGRLVATVGTATVKYGALVEGEEMDPPDQGEITPPDQGEITPPDQGEITPPDQGEVTPPDQGEITPPDQGEVTPPDQGEITSPDQGGTTPPDQGTSTPPDEGNAAAPNEEGPTSPDDPAEAPTTPKVGGYLLLVSVVVVIGGAALGILLKKRKTP